jgi:hypothetical protein
MTLDALPDPDATEPRPGWVEMVLGDMAEAGAVWGALRPSLRRLALFLSFTESDTLEPGGVCLTTETLQPGWMFIITITRRGRTLKCAATRSNGLIVSTYRTDRKVARHIWLDRQVTVDRLRLDLDWTLGRIDSNPPPIQPAR